MKSIHVQSLRKPKTFAVLLTLLVAISRPCSVAAQSQPAQIMFVGVTHLEAKRDVHNSAFSDDPLGARMQAQIADVLTHLARFHPTKVLVEAPYRSARVERQYADYLAHRYVLTRNEVDQLGFRLAAMSGNRNIYPVDDPGPAPYDDNSPQGKAMDAVLQAQVPLIERRAPKFAAFVARAQELEQSGTLLQLLRFINTQDAIRTNASWYTMADRMDFNGTQAGLAYTAAWYTRNLHIYANIMSEVQPGDRAVVLMGQGHEYLIRQLLDLSPDVESIDPLRYL